MTVGDLPCLQLHRTVGVIRRAISVRNSSGTRRRDLDGMTPTRYAYLLTMQHLECRRPPADSAFQPWLRFSSLLKHLKVSLRSYRPLVRGDQKLRALKYGAIVLGMPPRAQPLRHETPLLPLTGLCA